MATPLATQGVATRAETIAVIGAGYVGISNAVLLAHFGHDVVIAEHDETRRTLLQKGFSPILEADLETMLSDLLGKGRLKVVGDAATAVAGARFVFLCVATPMKTDGHADLRFIDAAVLQIRENLRSDAIVVNKSTVPVGTSEHVSQLISREGIHVVSNPEFLREGSAILDSFGPDRTIVGSDHLESAQFVGELFAPTGAPLVVTDARSAELIKYAANAFLATKISFVNSMSQLSSALGANISDVVRGVGADPRIGFAYMQPGPGWGGSCLPKDTSALVAISSEAGVPLPVVQGSITANQQQQAHIIDQIRLLVGGDLSGYRIGILGLTFKSNTADRRDSPALEIANLLRTAGATVAAYDPTVSPDEIALDLAGIRVVASALEAARGASAVVVLTEWPEFKTLQFDLLRDVMEEAAIYDCRDAIDVDAARAAGFRIAGIR